MNPEDKKPCEYSNQLATSYLEKSSIKRRKDYGQFFTPPSIARFMAGLADYRKDILRVLDPGAGAGMLSCAVCEAVSKKHGVKSLEIEAYEIDSELASLAEKSLAFAAEWLKNKNIELSYKVIRNDFLLSYQPLLWADEIIHFDLVIANPPYFKIGKTDPRAISASRFVYGQPNIYALFMGVAAELLNENGIFVMITPRSFASGPYFKMFRQRFFKNVTPARIHLFESRKEAFQKDDVLQENIILKAVRTHQNPLIEISVSKGIDDLDDPVKHFLPIHQVLEPSNKGRILRLPVSEHDIEIIDIVDSWPGSLHKFGLEISTGPVVPFRAEDLISGQNDQIDELVPLIWMHNVLPMRVEWPGLNRKNGKSKPQFIRACRESYKRRLLVEDRNLVLLRRFSAKEQIRRLTAAPLLKGQIGSKFIGLENHINYIYRPKGHMDEELSLGLAALFNCSLLDAYFRISNGNTQVSATEIRAMPLPWFDVIQKIGRAILKQKNLLSLEEVDRIVWEIIRQRHSGEMKMAGGVAGA